MEGQAPAQFSTSGGCLECRDTGYSGRIGIYEILLMSPGCAPGHPKADLAKMRELAYKEGMKPLRIAAR